MELVATILGRQSHDEAVTRLATVLAVDGWMGGAPLAEIAREYGTVGPKSVAKLEAAVELGRRTLAARAARTADTISTPEDVVARREATARRARPRALPRIGAQHEEPAAQGHRGLSR